MESVVALGEGGTGALGMAMRNGGFKPSTWKLFVCSGRWDQRPEQWW